MKTIGIIALSGVCEKEKIQAAKSYFEEKGYKVKLSSNILDSDRYLAGSDKDKINELHKFFKDSEIDLILAARGGYGTIRLINNIDYDIIRKNPKPICGYSDVTALLLMIYKKTGLITYHGPMACSDFGINRVTNPNPLLLGEGVNCFTAQHFFKAINNDPLNFTGTKVYKEGSAEGFLWGGNLATVVSLCGLDFIPDEDFIFFAEDLNEPVYKIDKMFTQLFNIEKFRGNCRGIVLGDFLNIDNKEWLDTLFTSFPAPTVGGFKITHAKEKLTLPIGKLARLENNILYI